jgi:hypothetical protein
LVDEIEVTGFTVTGFRIDLSEFVVVIVWSPFIFQGGRIGKGKGVVSSFSLVPEK